MILATFCIISVLIGVITTGMVAIAVNSIGGLTPFSMIVILIGEWLLGILFTLSIKFAKDELEERRIEKVFAEEEKRQNEEL